MSLRSITALTPDTQDPAKESRREQILAKVTVDSPAWLRGRFLAKATTNYPAALRAEDAVHWMRGEVRIWPTATQARRLFRVNAQQLRLARERIEYRERAKQRVFGVGTTTLSDDAVERIVVEVGPERIWKAVDRLTQPPVAAE
jgi:hypothetical protein